MKNNLTIIIVDDSKIICDRIISFLKEIPQVGNILCAYNFDDGVKLLKSHPSDFALLDINLPDKNGMELLRLVKEKAFPVKTIIMMTEDASDAKKAKCVELGADYFLNKFSEFENIPAIINHLIND